MDLSTLLKKTEKRSTTIKNYRSAPSVAANDRPYVNDLNIVETQAAELEQRTKSEQIQNKVRTTNATGIHKSEQSQYTTQNKTQNKVRTKSEQSQNNRRFSFALWIATQDRPLHI